MILAGRTEPGRLARYALKHGSKGHLAAEKGWMGLILLLIQSVIVKMVDDNDPWYDGLIEEFDRKHRARAIENRKRNPPPVNHAALTALMDHWRPETHSFHLACGEMAMTLEDMAMIIGLPINGLAVTGHVSAIN
ncbi:Alpha-L-arabinofuranosidase 1 [Hordeum vulgare]|nr:Alpha-L-arabinofuranosidase 1 [Hordeum vulgare]